MITFERRESLCCRLLYVYLDGCFLSAIHDYSSSSIHRVWLSFETAIVGPLLDSDDDGFDSLDDAIDYIERRCSVALKRSISIDPISLIQILAIPSESAPFQPLDVTYERNNP